MPLGDLGDKAGVKGRLVGLALHPSPIPPESASAGCPTPLGKYVTSSFDDIIVNACDIMVTMTGLGTSFRPQWEGAHQALLFVREGNEVRMVRSPHGFVTK